MEHWVPNDLAQEVLQIYLQMYYKYIRINKWKHFSHELPRRYVFYRTMISSASFCLLPIAVNNNLDSVLRL
jgi:hypothetical protein